MSNIQVILISEKVDTGLCGHPVPPRRRQNSFFARSFGSSGRRGHRHGAVDVVVAAKIEMRVPGVLAVAVHLYLRTSGKV